jgi:Tol biopolymer transport system component
MKRCTRGLYLRSIDEFEAKLIAGTDKDSKHPFFSPDGQSIGYFSQSDQKLKKVSINGGAPVILCHISTLVLGASWDSEDMIVYSDVTGGGIFRISTNGGTPEPLIKVELAKMKEDGFPVYPQILPDRKTLLFTSAFDFNAAIQSDLINAA